MKTIGLCMIVKDEAHVILRCLASVRMLIDYALIVDTGSTDGTQELIREYFREANLPGLVIDEPWKNFAYNRTFALDALRKISWIDYALVIDADDQFVFKDEFDVKRFKEAVEYDIYDVEISHGDVSYCRPQICRNALPFRYRGVLHEYLESPSGDLTRGRAEDFYVKFNGGGARSQNPHKYQEDAALLERALSTETDPFLVSRYIFYLAQSYRDSGNSEKALEFYLRRADLGFWNEEIYVSLLEAGNLMAKFGRPFEEVVAAYLRASDTVPVRAEALHAASRYCREHGRNAEGYEIARRGLDLALPKDTLFAEAWVYDYGLLDEFAVNAYWAGAYRESLDACLRLLERGCLPQSMYARVAANARFAAEKLRPPADLGSLGNDGFVEQHALAPNRHLHSRVAGAPRVLLAILAKQKEADLPLYLECIEGLDYPKSSLVLYIRTNNNTDRTEQILREWVARVGHLYAGVEFDATNVVTPVEEFREHEWNAVRFHVLGHIRNRSLQRALDLGCEFYFVVDVDNFVRRATLRELIALNLPIAAPLLRPVIPEKFYSNYHAEIDQAGYYKECDQYLWILSRHVRGLIEVPVVHCTYLIRADVIPELTYQDGTERHEYVIFSDSARKASIPQYLDNRQIYGYLTFTEGDLHVGDGLERARALLRNDVSQNEQHPEVFRKPTGVCHIPGEILSLKEVIELWVEGEVLSPRFMDWYRGGLAQRIRQGASRLELSYSERKKLRKMNARGPFLSRYYKDIKLFQLTRWSVDRLAELRCMPEMDPTKSGRLITLREYALSPPTARSRDPRLAASKIPAGEPSVGNRPILVGFDPENCCEVLLDGYLRGILFLRSAQASDTLPVLVPLQRPDVDEETIPSDAIPRWTPPAQFEKAAAE